MDISGGVGGDNDFQLIITITTHNDHLNLIICDCLVRLLISRITQFIVQ